MRVGKIISPAWALSAALLVGVVAEVPASLTVPTSSLRLAPPTPQEIAQQRAGLAFDKMKAAGEAVTAAMKARDGRAFNISQERYDQEQSRLVDEIKAMTLAGVAPERIDLWEAKAFSASIGFQQTWQELLGEILETRKPDEKAQMHAVLVSDLDEYLVEFKELGLAVQAELETDETSLEYRRLLREYQEKAVQLEGAWMLLNRTGAKPDVISQYKKSIEDAAGAFDKKAHEIIGKKPEGRRDGIALPLRPVLLAPAP